MRKKIRVMPGQKMLAFHSRVFAAKDRDMVKAHSNELRSLVLPLAEHLKGDEVLMIISKKQLDKLYTRIKSADSKYKEERL